MFRNAKKLAGKGRKPKLFMLGKNSFKANAVWQPNRSHNETASALALAPKAKSRPVSRKAGGGIPEFIPPQLCKRVHRPPEGQEWVHEIKLDGYRMHLRAVHGDVVMRTRSGLDWTGKFAAITDAGSGFPNCIIDGDVVALDRNGIPDFAALQVALSDGRSQDLTYFVFDLLFEGAKDLRRMPLTTRKDRLVKLLSHKGTHASSFSWPKCNAALAA